MSLVTSITHYNTTMPEQVTPVPDYATLVSTMLQYLEDWITVSSEITQDIRRLKPEDLSLAGRQIADLFSTIMRPPSQLRGSLPSDRYSIARSEPLSAAEIILNWFHDCFEWVSQIKSDIEAIHMEGALRQDPFLLENLYPLLVFFMIPGTNFLHWFLYFWKRHSTPFPRTQFRATVGAPYTIPDIFSRLNFGQEGFVADDNDLQRPNGFWQASYYPVRGAWGSQETYHVLSELLRQNHSVAVRRLMKLQLRTNRMLNSFRQPAPHNQIVELDDNDPGEDCSESNPSTASELGDGDGESVLCSPQSTETSNDSEVTTTSNKLRRSTSGRSKSCPHCPRLKPFTLWKDLERHIDSIHSEAKFYCTIVTCSRFEGGRAFNRVDNRDRHMKKAHGLKLPSKRSPSYK
ncbi:hypothetical protein PVAG01_02648 [Phlyctema vagabunda]|uniref:C2H2-type domain-containing protein n=1 Tax=Phlyctema vagabunda TaxID=108571 RepID=A0ABR4PRT5_9HELO